MNQPRYPDRFIVFPSLPDWGLARSTARANSCRPLKTCSASKSQALKSMPTSLDGSFRSALAIPNMEVHWQVTILEGKSIEQTQFRSTVLFQHPIASKNDCIFSPVREIGNIDTSLRSVQICSRHLIKRMRLFCGEEKL